MMNHLATPFLLALACSTALASPAWAGDDAATSAAPVDPGEIVVTAQRREQTAASVPMSIQAFGGDQLKRLRVTSVQDLANVVPGFRATTTAQGVPNYYLRGIGFNTINQSATSPVGTYVDEVAYPYPIMNAGPVFDLERVEVLKGPQGTLFGRNTTAGLIDFVTAKPSDKFEARIIAEGGNNATHNMEGMISGPITARLQGRLAFRTEDSDQGWQKSLSRNETLGEIHKYGLRASLAAQPTDRLTIDLSYNFWYNRSDTQAAQMIAFSPTVNPATNGAYAAYLQPGFTTFFAAHKPTSGADADWDPITERGQSLGTPGVAGYGPGITDPNAEDTMLHAGKLKIGYALAPNISLVSLTGYSKLIRDAVTDSSGAPFEISIEKIKGTISSFNQELHLEAHNDFVNALVGGYYASDRLYDSAIEQSNDGAAHRAVRVLTTALLSQPINNGLGYTQDNVTSAFRAYRDAGNFRSSTWSAFANADWKFTPTLGLTTGIRYTQDKQHYKGCTQDYEGSLVTIVNLFNRTNWSKLASSKGVAPAPIGLNQCNEYDPTTNSFGYYISDVNEHNVSFRAALNWTPATDMLLFASVSRGFKNADTPVNAATIITQNIPARQEELTAYELGMKGKFLSRRVLLNAAVFYYDYRDKQAIGNYTDPIYKVLTQLQNIPKSEAYGVDADLTWHIARPLTAILSGTYLHTAIKSFPNAIGVTGQPVNLIGDRFAYAPSFSSAATLLVDQPLSERLTLTGDASVRYQTRSNATLEGDPLYAIPAYAVVNASLGLRSPTQRWKASLWVRNLANKYYWTQVISNSNAIVRYAGQTRTFGLTLAKDF